VSDLKWAQLGSNQRPPDYEFPIVISIGLHGFVSVCACLSYFTLKVKYYTGLHDFIEILAQILALEIPGSIMKWQMNL
jgi:hypothetical protein